MVRSFHIADMAEGGNSDHEEPRVKYWAVLFGTYFIDTLQAHLTEQAIMCEDIMPEWDDAINLSVASEYVHNQKDVLFW